MKIAVTGADQGLGNLLCTQLAEAHEVVAWGRAAEPQMQVQGRYLSVDLLHREAVGEAVVGLEAIVHAAPFDPPRAQGDEAEAELLDWVARGTYGLVMEAAGAEVSRLVLISCLSLVEDYPQDWVVRENWSPRPQPEANALAPYTAELVGREVARTGRIEVSCLRLGAIDGPEGTSAEDAVSAVAEALEQPSRSGGHSWTLRHVASRGRFAR